MGLCDKFHICGLNRIKNDISCILHSNNSEKNKAEFTITFKDYFNNSGLNFRYFIFPEFMDFQNIRFEQKIDFRDTVFKKGVSFRGASFKKAVLFSRAVFLQKADFSNVTFNWIAIFSGVQFNKGAKFTESTFGIVANFSRSYFAGKTIISSEATIRNGKSVFYKTLVKFNNLILKSNDLIEISGADFRKVSLSGTDLREFRLKRIRWPVINYRFALYDEIILRKKLSNKDEVNSEVYSEIEKLYRDLKINYEKNRNWSFSGNFHYREKEMQRKNKKNSFFFRWILLQPYWLLSGYGESVVNPIFWGSLLFIVCSICYLLPGFSNIGGLPLSIHNILVSCAFSFQNMFFLKPTDLTPLFLGKAVKIVQSLLGPFFLGLLALAVRQRLKR